MNNDKIAIIKTGGRQHKIKENDIIKVNRLKGEPGSQIEFSDILDKQKVTAEIIEHKKDKKVLILKHHPKKRYVRKKGHRQEISAIKIKNIE